MNFVYFVVNCQQTVNLSIFLFFPSILFYRALSISHRSFSAHQVAWHGVLCPAVTDGIVVYLIISQRFLPQLPRALVPAQSINNNKLLSESCISRVTLDHNAIHPPTISRTKYKVHWPLETNYINIIITRVGGMDMKLHSRLLRFCFSSQDIRL